MASLCSPDDFKQKVDDSELDYGDDNRRVRVISITSGKGGVGKSSVVLNLAISLAKRGKKVVILDADVGMANVDVMLGIRPEKDLSHVLSGKCRLNDVIVTGPYGIKLIPGGSGFAEFSSFTNDQKLQLLNEVEDLDDDVDYLLIDTAPGITSNVTFFNTCAAEIIVISNSEPTSITDAYALIKVLHTNHKIKHFSLLVNNVSTEREAIGVYKKLAYVSERFLNISLNYVGYLPYDKMIGVSIKEQNPLLNSKRSTPYSVKLTKLSTRLDASNPETPLMGNLQFFFKRLVELT